MSGPQGPEKPEQTSFIKDSPLMKHKYPADEHNSFLEMAKGKDGCKGSDLLELENYVLWRSSLC